MNGRHYTAVNEGEIVFYSQHGEDEKLERIVQTDRRQEGAVH